MCDNIDTERLKEYIIENDLIFDILEKLDIEYYDKGHYITMKNPDGDNITAVTLFKNSLKVQNHTRGWNGDIITLIQEFTQCEFKMALKVLTDIVGNNFNKKEKPNLLKALDDLEKNIKHLPNKIDDEPLNETIFEKYLHKPNKLWFDEGIGLDTQAEFEICYDDKSDSIIIPIRNKDGVLLGIKNRKNTSEDVYMKYYYSEPYKRTNHLYGLHKTKEYIIKNKYCIVVESEKSVMKLWENGIKSSVAIGSHDLSERQIVLLEELGVPIILAFDKDIILRDCGNSCSECKNKCINFQMKKFIKSIDVSCIIDDDNLLDEKNSPIDKGIEVFKEIFKNRYKRG